MNTERKELIKRVEKLLGWGEVANWSNYDFEKLSDVIHSKRVEAKNRFISFYVNEVKAEAFEFPNAPTDIVAVQYRFNGPSAVKYAQFKTDDKVISLE